MVEMMIDGRDDGRLDGTKDNERIMRIARSKKNEKNRT